MVKPPAGYRPLAYSSPEAVQTTGTVAGVQLVRYSNFGTKLCFLSSLRISRSAVRVSRRRWTSMSRTSPSWSTARHRYTLRRRSEPPSHQGAIGYSGEDGASVAAARSPVRTSAPSSGRFRRRRPAPLSARRSSTVSVAEREAQVEPNRMLDDNRRKPVTTV